MIFNIKINQTNSHRQVMKGLLVLMLLLVSVVASPISEEDDVVFKDTGTVEPPNTAILGTGEIRRYSENSSIGSRIVYYIL